MPLQIDATTRYATGNYTKPADPVAAELDIAVQHADPQGPHADADRQPEPGVDPGRGASRPSTNFLYFVVKPCGNGEHVFASNYNQFLGSGAALPLRAQRARRTLAGALLRHVGAAHPPRRARLAGRAQPLAADPERRARGGRPERLALPAAAGPARAVRRDRAGARGGRVPRRQRHDPAQAGGARARRRARPPPRAGDRRRQHAARSATTARSTPTTPTRRR